MNRREFLKTLEGIVIFCCICSIPLISGCAKSPVEAEPESILNSNPIIKDGIEYYIQTDKKIYSLGEEVEMLYRVTNLSDEAMGFTFDDQVQYYFAVTKDGNLTYYWYPSSNFDGNLIWFAPKVGLPAGSSFVLEPGGHKEYTETWNMINENGTNQLNDDFLVSPGDYYVTGSFHHYVLNEKDKYVPVSVPIKIIQ